MIETDFSFNWIKFIASVLSYTVIIFIAVRIYMKQNVKPGLWAVPLVWIAGLFSFSIDMNWFDMPLKLAILPLGLWILYFFMKNKEGQWERYRSFAWLGFWANYIFLAMALLSVPFHQWVYPKEQLSTYITETEGASLISIHPAAKEGQQFQPEKFLKQLDVMKSEKVMNDEWYTRFYLETEASKRSERFPYFLNGTHPKRGSGMQPMIFIEDDRKGMLVTTSARQLYFRSSESFITGGDRR
ncbi:MULTISPECIES: hypothetical protein [Sporosarcina]|uniref:hypothetical protein n=1 Tax=Sporosarcina TaxID=1569 RepID=UPI001E452131|nr:MULTISPECIES: hypothetical protein [Sporosarcina]GKV65311.1 hypothetical protein NCCP2331_14640 [Sporosarcina sp. NCCP-2331]GLB55435.1 hypothetical protein NCCP2378_12220 [Sporosarcina sp. NCCP-2378]